MRAGLLPFLAVATLIAVPAAARPVGPGVLRDSSWGKPGVGLEQYWRDSAECAYQAVMLDLSGTDPAKQLVAASRELDGMWMSLPAAGSMSEATNYGISYQRAYDKYRPDVQYEEAKAIQKASLETCLKQRGYVRFALTDDQQERLRHLHRGSYERRQYLYQLGTDPAVLEHQHL
jgi:hypothetical protein